jgi:hypothetical protein
MTRGGCLALPWRQDPSRAPRLTSDLLAATCLTPLARTGGGDGQRLIVRLGRHPGLRALGLAARLPGWR